MTYAVGNDLVTKKAGVPAKVPQLLKIITDPLVLICLELYLLGLVQGFFYSR